MESGAPSRQMTGSLFELFEEASATDDVPMEAFSGRYGNRRVHSIGRHGPRRRYASRSGTRIDDSRANNDAGTGRRGPIFR